MRGETTFLSVRVGEGGGTTGHSFKSSRFFSRLLPTMEGREVGKGSGWREQLWRGVPAQGKHIDTFEIVSRKICLFEAWTLLC